MFVSNVLQSERLDFCATDIFPGTCIDFCFMMFTEVLINDLSHILIYIRKLFTCRVSFKMLFSTCLVTDEKKL